jgi:GNAT superfamily N-acetyltransferase
MTTEYSAFTQEMIPAAGELLARRHARNRAALPLLPQRFEDPQVAARAVENLWNRKLKNGFAALRDGKLIAYVLGELAAETWGRTGYVYLPGYALAQDESPRVLQDLYSLLGDEWVKKGAFLHELYISATEQNNLAAFFDLGFGKERIDALLDLSALKFPDIKTPAGVQIRQAGAGDNDQIGSLSGVIMRALASAPYWHPTVPEDYDEMREGWSELADDREWTVWLALENNKTLGAIGFCPEPEKDTQMLAPASTVYLSVAATQPAARGRGINTALSWHGLEQAQKAGFATCYTNWISPNLLAARFWPRFGFRDAAYRLSKRVDPTIAWTRD